ncbi:MAG: RluA family pseudouridine synthase [Fusobacteriaceae bacterium]
MVYYRIDKIRGEGMEFIIDEKYAGARVDRFLRKLLPDTALTEIFKGIRTGNIKVNGKKTKENNRLELGDTVKIFRVPGLEALEAVNQKEENYIKISSEELKIIKECIVYEDEKVSIINKPANTVMHKGSGHDYGWSELLKSYYKNPDFSFVNRIDKATSGLVVGAKTLPVARELSEEIRENNTDKRYYIVVEGVVKMNSFTKTTYLMKTEEKVVEFETYKPGTKESTSHFKVLSRGKNRTLLEGKLDSGRTHQLRVQLSNIGHPIVGDYKYGAKMNSKRMMLHSYYLEIPRYNLKLILEIPEEFKTF